MNIVVLSSGGIDSSLMMYLFKKDGHVVLPLHIDYGQLAEEREWKSCVEISKQLSLFPEKLDVSGFGKLIRSGLTDGSLDVYEDAFLPTRNLLFLTLGAAYAFSRSCSVVAIGLLANPIFPDQGKEFVRKAQESISASLGKPIHFLTPLIELDKRDVLKLAEEHRIPTVTYYCHSGTETPCGKCISCQERIAAEKSLLEEK